MKRWDDIVFELTMWAVAGVVVVLIPVVVVVQTIHALR